MSKEPQKKLITDAQLQQIVSAATNAGRADKRAQIANEELVLAQNEFQGSNQTIGAITRSLEVYEEPETEKESDLP